MRVIWGVGGMMAGALLMWLYQDLRQPSTFEECFLAEADGKQSALFKIVRKVCRERFPAVELSDEDIWGPKGTGN